MPSAQLLVRIPCPGCAAEIASTIGRRALWADGTLADGITRPFLAYACIALGSHQGPWMLAIRALRFSDRTRAEKQRQSSKQCCEGRARPHANLGHTRVGTTRKRVIGCQ